MWQEALEYCSPKWKGIITLATSSGMGAAEVMSLTYNQWLDAISCKHLTQDERKEQGKYVNLDELTESEKLDVIKIDRMIKEAGLIVPVWGIKRIKTKFPYKTFSTPESVKEISNYLKHRRLTKSPVKSLDDRLFVTGTLIETQPMNILNFTSEFHRLRGKFQINDGYKKNGRYFVFRSHAMRKYAGSNILEYTDLGFLKTEFIMGHKRHGQDRGYYKKHTGELRKAYIAGLNKLSINWNENDLVAADEYTTLKQRLAA